MSETFLMILCGHFLLQDSSILANTDFVFMPEVWGFSKSRIQGIIQYIISCVCPRCKF